MKGIISVLLQQVRLIALTGWTAGIYYSESLQELFARRTRAITVRQEWVHRWCLGARRILGLQLTVQGSAPERGARGRVVISNHRCPIDALVLMEFFGGRILANHKVARAPIIGKGAMKAGTLFVNRDDRRSGASAVRAMRSALESGHTILIFPEGTTSPGDEVRPFKTGAFRAADGLDVDFVPVGFAYPPGIEFFNETLGQHVRRMLARPVTHGAVSIGMPFRQQGSYRETSQQARELVQALVNSARASLSR